MDDGAGAAGAVDNGAAAAVDHTDDKPVTFKEIHGIASRYYMCRRCVEPIGLSAYYCTCPQFAQKAMCKHSLGLSIQVGLKVPAEANVSVVGGRRKKRGRPKKKGNCLTKPINVAEGK